VKFQEEITNKNENTKSKRITFFQRNVNLEDSKELENEED